MEKVFTNVPDGLPEDYPLKTPETGTEVTEWKNSNRRIFNALHELNPFDEPRAIIKIDKWGLENFERDPGIFLPNQVGFLVVSMFPGINNLNPESESMDRLDIGAAYSPRLRQLSLVFEPNSVGRDFERWGFLHRVAERLA